MIDLPDPVMLTDVQVEYHEHRWTLRPGRGYVCTHVNARQHPHLTEPVITR